MLLESGEIGVVSERARVFVGEMARQGAGRDLTNKGHSDESNVLMVVDKVVRAEDEWIGVKRIIAECGKSKVRGKEGRGCRRYALSCVYNPIPLVILHERSGGWGAGNHAHISHDLVIKPLTTRFWGR